MCQVQVLRGCTDLTCLVSSVFWSRKPFSSKYLAELKYVFLIVYHRELRLICTLSICILFASYPDQRRFGVLDSITKASAPLTIVSMATSSVP